jgi:hypothetical protein
VSRRARCRMKSLTMVALAGAVVALALAGCGKVVADE